MKMYEMIFFVYFFKNKLILAKMEDPGIEPGASCMLSKRSTNELDPRLKDLVISL